MSQMQEIIKEIAKDKELVASEKALQEVTNPHVRRTRMGHITKAKENLKELFLQYRQALQDSAVFILVTGPECEKFAERSSSEDFSCFAQDGDEFYKELTEGIPAVLYQGKQASRGLFDHFNSQFEARASHIGIVGFNAMLFESKYKKVMNNKADLVSTFKQAFNDKVGSEAVALDVVDKVANRAYDNNFDGKVAPIVVFSKDEDLIKDFSRNFKKVSNNVFIISTGKRINKELKQNSICSLKEVDDDGIEKSLLKIKENLT